MLDLDNFNEILGVMRKNKMRTLLTGFSVAWGIFMFILLLGIGQSLINGFSAEFSDDAINSIWISSGQTSIPHNGLKPGRYIQMTNDDFDYIKANVLPPGEHMSSRFNRWGGNTVNYATKSNSYTLRCTHPGHQFLENTIITKGRFLNDNDVAERRKVAVIGNMIQQELFGEEDPIGKTIKVNGIAFKVVGEFKDEGNEREARIIYVPISTGQRVFNGRNYVHQILFTGGDATVEETLAIVEKVRVAMANRHNFAVKDERAIYVRANLEEYEKIMGVLGGIKFFVGIMGFMTIVAGIVGVSNIMLISVKERTREFGIRKAIGASPGSITGMVLAEAVLITGLFGYIGLTLGVFTLELLRDFISNPDIDAGIFLNPEINIKIAITATIILIVSGAIAGLIPALRAGKIRPMLALKDE